MSHISWTRPIDFQVDRRPASGAQIRLVGALLTLGAITWGIVTLWALDSNANSVAMAVSVISAVVGLLGVLALVSANRYRTTLLRRGHTIAVDLETGAVLYDAEALLDQVAGRFRHFGVKLNRQTGVREAVESALNHYTDIAGEHERDAAMWALERDLTLLHQLIEGHEGVEESDPPVLDVQGALVERALVLTDVFLRSGDFELADRLREAVARRQLGIGASRSAEQYLPQLPTTRRPDDDE